jgi:pimeloyl-ACP methyl ester carboxylesterase
MGWTGRLRSLMATCVAATIAVGTIAYVPAARAASADTPVYLVHGFRTRGTDCGQEWGTAIPALQARGVGPVRTVGIYHNDVNCSVPISVGNPDVRVRELGRLLAWEVYRREAAAGRSVDLVGHSMGGLIIRAALTGVARHEPDFPPLLRVRAAVTLGTPHAGTNWAQVCRLVWNQCRDMVPHSALLRWLADDPQGTDGTAWTLLATESDFEVSTASATAMSAVLKVRYRARQRLGHAALLRAVTGTYAAWTWRREDPVWRLREATPAPIALTAMVLRAAVPVLPARS